MFYRCPFTLLWQPDANLPDGRESSVKSIPEVWSWAELVKLTQTFRPPPSGVKKIILGLNLVFEALGFRNEGTHLKSKTFIGSADDVFPRLVQLHGPLKSENIYHEFVARSSARKGPSSSWVCINNLLMHCQVLLKSGRLVHHVSPKIAEWLNTLVIFKMADGAQLWKWLHHTFRSQSRNEATCLKPETSFGSADTDVAVNHIYYIAGN